MTKHWTLDDIPWASFDRAKIDPELIKIAKAASLVEANGEDYAAYLCNVFNDDPAFQRITIDWAREEVQHGAALARWARLADPDFDFDAALARFKAGFRIPIEAVASIRGSRSGELVARCIVETGTFSHYTALMEASDEPVLKEICRNIAADELRHYKLFYTHMKRYLAKERIGVMRRIAVAIGRLLESEGDDELAFAYYAANGTGEAYNRRRSADAYMRRAYGFCHDHHVQRGIAMVLKAAGLTPNGRLNAWLTRLACYFVRTRQARLVRAGV
jgi:rubrerythrin